MPNCIIGIGKWSTLYINILLAAIFKCLRDCLLNFNSISPDSKLGLFGFEPILSHHTIITSIYIYLSYFLFGLIFFYISNIRKKIIINFKKIFQIMIISLIFVFHSDLIKILYLFGFSDFDIWTFDIIFILFFMNKYFVINIYTHQKFSIDFIIIISTFFIFLSMFFSSNEEKSNSFESIYNLVGNIIFCFLIFLGFLLISFITAFGRVITKVLMDLKFTSPHIIIICTGIFGFILNLIILIFVSKHNCRNTTIFNNSCLVKSEKEDKTYFDNTNTYFSNLNESLKGIEPLGVRYTKKIKFFVEILAIVPLFLVFSYFEFYFELKTINFLNPIYILASTILFFKYIMNYEFVLFSIFNESSFFENYFKANIFIKYI